MQKSLIHSLPNAQKLFMSSFIPDVSRSGFLDAGPVRGTAETLFLAWYFSKRPKIVQFPRAMFVQKNPIFYFCEYQDYRLGGGDVNGIIKSRMGGSGSAEFAIIGLSF